MMIVKLPEFESSLQKINSREQKSGFQIFDLPKFCIFPIGLEKIFFENSEIFPIGCFPIGLVDCIRLYNDFQWQRLKRLFWYQLI